MPLLDKLKNVFSNGTANLIEKAGDAIDKVFTNKEERDLAKLELEKAIHSHIEKMAENTLKQFEAEIKDLENARNREIEIATSDKAPLINKIITPILALLILGSTFLMWYIILFKDIDVKKEILVAGIIGSLTTISMGVVGYYFGSSSGSKQKGDQLDKILNK